MFLKKMEFQGFKSFVEPTTMSFEPGISGVIGPNGCGKSNISDAIRWVLGEQSAKALRGGKMVDVIFNGTELRKPAGMAEVSLTISNEDRALPLDFAEITVTRRSFRSGETEYLINKAPARLKDIYALFSDTGIGTDGYSLLEQGKMDLILSSKPMDRRSVFEEAAGITKYKTQRDEALRKLEATDQNLLRATDIVNEVKRQINSLERQARKAEKYQVLKAELDQLRSRLLVKEVQAARQALQAAEASLQALRDALDAMEARQREQDAGLQVLRHELSRDEEALARANQGLYALEGEAAQLDRQQALNLAQVQNLEQRAAASLEDASEQRRRESGLQGELAAARAEEAKEQSALAELQLRLREAESALASVAAQRREKDSQAQQLQQRLIQFLDEKSAVKAEAEALQGRLAMVDARVQALEEELRQSQSALQDAGRRLEQAAAQAGEKGEEVRSLEQSLGGQYLRKRELEEALRASEESVTARQVLLGSERARLEALLELSQALEGYEAGPKALLQAASRGEAPAALQSLAHRLRAKPEAEAAVELALGKRLQTLLAEDEKAALAALQWLKDGRLGRAAVLPRAAFKPAPELLPSDLAGRPGVLGPLAAFIEADAGLEPLVGWMARGLVLVKDLDAAKSLAPQLPAGCQAVSLDGWILGAEGLLEGGSSDTAERGLLSREREIASLKASISQGEELVLALEGDRDRQRGELNALSHAIEQESRKKSDAQIAAARLQEEEGARRGEVGRLAGESEEKRRSIEGVQVEAAGFRARREALERQGQEMAALEARQQQELRELLDAIETLRREEETQIQGVNAQRVAQAGTDQRLQNLRVSALRLEQELRASSEQAARREAEAAAARAEQEDLKRRNEALEAELKALFERRSQAQERVSQLNQARGERAEAIRASEEDLRRLRQESSSQAEERHTQEMGAQEQRLRLSSLEQTLVHEYHVDLAALDQDQLFIQSGEAAEGPQAEPDPERAEELKRKLDELGMVNPAAAEEYRELEQRHSLLVGQLEDLRSAKSDLLRLIQKINQESRDRFLATFEKVHEAFKRTYRALFGGGEAKLSLLEEGDLLEAGIEITARPPGKKLQSISLLSGGEKALTATALLFALFETKPSPFCVLDEIDAPLDDNNIGRFTALLDEYAKKTQFIVMTHSKLTMEHANVLYGLTMEEPGVSRVISVRFRDN